MNAGTGAASPTMTAGSRVVRVQLFRPNMLTRSREQRGGRKRVQFVTTHDY